MHLNKIATDKQVDKSYANLSVEKCYALFVRQ